MAKGFGVTADIEASVERPFGVADQIAVDNTRIILYSGLPSGVARTMSPEPALH